jgi:hypothetical protein
MHCTSTGPLTLASNHDFAFAGLEADVKDLKGVVGAVQTDVKELKAPH